MPSENARHNVMTIRLSDDEMRALQQFQGDRNIDKVRTAIQSNSIANAIAEPMVRELENMNKRIENLETHDQHQRDELRGLRKRIDNEPVVLPQGAQSILDKLAEAIPMMARKLGEIDKNVKNRQSG